MKLVSINIELNRHYDNVLNFLKKENPDVVCLQELLEEDFERFKKELNLEGVFAVFKYAMVGYYGDLKGKRFGVGIFAKNIVGSGHIFYFGSEGNVDRPYEEYITDIENRENDVLLWADVKDDNGDVFRFTTTHPPVTKEGTVSVLQVAVIDKLLETLEKIPEFILCGDMNAPRGNATFDRIAKKYKDNIPLEYKTSIDQNLHKVKGIQFVVDGLFTTPGYVAKDVKLVDGVSDHMAIVANIEKGV
jgi:exonuclease III